MDFNMKMANPHTKVSLNTSNYDKVLLASIPEFISKLPLEGIYIEITLNYHVKFCKVPMVPTKGRVILCEVLEYKISFHM